MLKSFRAKRRRAADLLRLLSKRKEGAFSFYLGVSTVATSGAVCGAMLSASVC
jgi:hypothetical protein